MPPYRTRLGRLEEEKRTVRLRQQCSSSSRTSPLPDEAEEEAPVHGCWWGSNDVPLPSLREITRLKDICKIQPSGLLGSD